MDLLELAHHRALPRPAIPTAATEGVRRSWLCLDKFIKPTPTTAAARKALATGASPPAPCRRARTSLLSNHGRSRHLTDQPLLTEMALYMNRIHIAGDYYINPGDASPIVHLDATRCLASADRLHNRTSELFAWPSLPKPPPPRTFRLLVAQYLAGNFRRKPISQATSSAARLLSRHMAASNLSDGSPQPSWIRRGPLSGMHSRRQRQKPQPQRHREFLGLLQRPSSPNRSSGRKLTRRRASTPTATKYPPPNPTSTTSPRSATCSRA